MITFNKKGKFEYQILCCTKKPLYISLRPNNTISKNFDSVISSIQAMSEIMGKEFDDYIFNFVNGYQKCNTEDERYAFLKKNVNKTFQFSTVFVNVNNIDYAEFADDTQRTNDSIFFDTKDIKKIIKLSQALKIYSIVLNTEAGISTENKKVIWNQFITLLNAIRFPSKLHKFLEILSIKARKRIRYYSEKKVDDEDNIDNLVWETHNFILYNGLITHDYKRNPIHFFIGIFKKYMEYGGKYQIDYAFDLIDDEVETIDDNLSKEKSTEKIIVDNFTLNRLYDISKFYLSRAYKSPHKTKFKDQRYLEILEKIEYSSPFWDAILAPLLSKSIGINYEKLKKISPQQAAAISFYSGIKSDYIFSSKYQNLFGLGYLFPINPPKSRNYRLKNVSHFINATLQFPINDLSHIRGSRIFIVRLIEAFIGKIKSTPFCSINTGDSFENIQIDKIEIETIDYIVRYFTNAFEKELVEFEQVIQNDFKIQKNKKNTKITKDTLRNTVNGKKYSLIEKKNLKSNNNEKPEKFDESKTDKQPHSKDSNTDLTPIPALAAGGSNINKRSKKSKGKGKSTIPKKYVRAYQTCKDTADLLKNYLKLKPNEIDQYLSEFQRSYDLLSNTYKAKVLNYANKTLSKINMKIVSKDGLLFIGEIKSYRVSIKEGRISKEYLVE